MGYWLGIVFSCLDVLCVAVFCDAFLERKTRGLRFVVGALLCGILYEKTGKLLPTYLGEVIGTGILGGMLCYPVAVVLMGKEAALFTYVMPFLMSTCCGTIMAAAFVGVLEKSHVISYIRGVMGDA